MKITSFIDEKYDIQLKEDWKESKDIFRKTYGNKILKTVDEYFDKFYTRIKKNSLNNDVKKYFEKLKKVYSDIFYTFLLKELAQEKIIWERESSKNIAVGVAVNHVLFLADLTLSLLIGDENNLKKITNRANQMTGQKLTKSKKIEYSKILNKQKELSTKFGVGTHPASLTNAIRQINKHLSEKEIKSIANSINYHIKKGNLP